MPGNFDIHVITVGAQGATGPAGSPASAGLVLLNRQVISGTPSTIEIPVGSDYDVYQLFASNITLSGNTIIQLGGGVDPSYAVPMEMVSVFGQSFNGTMSVLNVTAPEAPLRLTAAQAVVGGAGAVCSFNITFHRPWAASVARMFNFEAGFCFVLSSHVATQQGAILVAATEAAITALQLSLSAGTFTGGVVSLYGLSDT